MIDFIFRHIVAVLPVIVVAILMPYLVAKDSMSEPETDNTGRKVLKYSRTYGVIGWMSVILTGIITIIGIVFNSKSFADEQLIWLGFFGFGLVIGIPLILSRKNVAVAFDDQKVECSNMFGKQQIMIFADIQAIRINPYLQTLTLSDTNQKVGINMGMKGFDGFLNTLKGKLNSSLLENLQKEMNKLSKEFQH